jgi:hypothetical protein
MQARKKSRETRLSKVNREASNRGRNHSANPENWMKRRLPLNL